MNRLAPLIVRPMLAGYVALPAVWDGVDRRRPTPAGWLREFAIAWLGGVVFFGTLFA